MKILGYIAYEGPSVIDGRPIVVIVNKLNGSQNEKTGADLVQSFIIRADVGPVEALKTGADVSICGQCVHRPLLAKTNGQAPCYVNVDRSVRSVFEAYKRGRYTKATPAQLRAVLAGRKVRLGTYGDPAAAPVELWAEILADTAGHVGYSHQWQAVNFDHAAWAPLVMASADTADEAAQANLLACACSGYRSASIVSRVKPRAQRRPKVAKKPPATSACYAPVRQRPRVMW